MSTTRTPVPRVDAIPRFKSMAVGSTFRANPQAGRPAAQNVARNLFPQKSRRFGPPRPRTGEMATRPPTNGRSPRFRPKKRHCAGTDETFHLRSGLVKNRPQSSDVNGPSGHLLVGTATNRAPWRDLSTATAGHCRAESPALYLYPQMIWKSWCPHCRSHRIASYSNHCFLERVLPFLILHYRCTRCDLDCFKFRGIVHSR